MSSLRTPTRTPSTGAPAHPRPRLRANRVTLFLAGFAAFDVLIWTAAALVR